MDWNDSPAQAEFRAEVRALIEQHLPERYRRGEAHLPVEVWGVNAVRRLVQQVKRASSDTKPARAATGMPLENMGA